jgi:hypothetical protein
LGSFITNGAVSASLSFGEPFGSLIADGVATNMLGTGWDTHENGNNITFQNLKVIGGLYFGFVDRTINTRIINCESYNTLARAFQAGGTSVNCQVINFKFNQSNQGVDVQDGLDYRQTWPMFVRSNTFIGPVQSNSVLNSNIDVWTGGTSGFTTTGETADDWYLTVGAGATVAVARSARTLDNGIDSKYYLGLDRTVAGSDDSSIYGIVDDVRSFTAQTVNVSFDLRSNFSSIKVFIRQYFGTGGSPSASVDTPIFTLVPDIDWQRGSIQFDLPSIVGKTIGTNEDSQIQIVFALPIDATYTNANTPTIQIDRVKLEQLNVPTQYVDTI